MPPALWDYYENKTKRIKYLAQRLPQSKCSVNISSFSFLETLPNVQ